MADRPRTGEIRKAIGAVLDERAGAENYERSQRDARTGRRARRAGRDQSHRRPSLIKRVAGLLSP